MASGASPSSNSSVGATSSLRDVDLERKRARDRKSQQAMRDRVKTTVHTLSEQVSLLNRALEEQAGQAAQLNQRVEVLEGENEHLRVQNAALRLSLLGDHSSKEIPEGAAPLWQIPPKNTSPANPADRILQGVVTSGRKGMSTTVGAPGLAEPATVYYPLKPNLCTLLDKSSRADDEISNIAVDIVKSYTEIEELPNQVAVAYIMITFLKWLVLLDEPSWNQIPVWLRPTPTQLSIPHDAWIDRMPWPKMRDHLVAHPEITLDHLAAVYSSSFYIQWPYDPAHVLMTAEENSKLVVTNPIYEEHIRQLKNWVVGDKFRGRFPELAQAVDADVGT